MARPKKIKESVRLSVVLSREHAEIIKLMAIRMSSQQGRQITVCEAMRTALEEVYPVPKNQMGLF